MKNLFKMMGIALVACSMFAACGSDWTVTATANDEAMGTVTGGGDYADGTECTLTATPNADYEFVSWSDGKTDNPYTFTVTSDVNLVATFKHVDGIKVTFNGASWNANDAASHIYLVSAQNTCGARASSTADGQSYPLADAFWFGNSTGSFTDNTSDGQNYNNNVINYVEYYETGALQNQQGTLFGDWWAKSATINVSAFDATSMDLGANVDATMFNAREAFVGETAVGFAAASTAPMGMDIYGTMTAASKGVVPVKVRDITNLK
ncbi:MAG: hypothetical protein IKR79_02150 [Bacteroidales bacterium]|nr:hypothetical protein [Bacteroidales bacterium]MBR6330433.1 hypothetical protein [Bacteroidales bacterium]